jgi:hypothetical protein
VTTGEKALDMATDCLRKLLDTSQQLCRVQFLHMGGMTHAADYPVCAHCSELTGRLIAAPCPTSQTLESSDEALLAADRYRHFVLNGFTQEQWDDAARDLGVQP